MSNLPAGAASDPYAPWRVVLCPVEDCDAEVFPQQAEAHLADVHGIEQEGD